MKIGAMNDPTRSVYEEVEFFGNAKFDFVDLTIEGPEASDVDTDRLRKLLDRHGLTVTGHTDPCLPFAYPVLSVRHACLKELERCAAIFHSLGASVMNIHPCYFSPPALRQKLIDLNIEALPPIVNMAASYGLTVVMENFTAPFDQAATFLRILSQVPGLKMHLDVGHANMGRDGCGVFCESLGSHIRHVHFSDNRGRSDDHMPLGVGNIDWKNAVNALKTTGYDGTVTLEVFCADPDMRLLYLNLSRQRALALWYQERSSIDGRAS